MSKKPQLVFFLLGVFWILNGAAMSSSIWGRIEALSWPIVEAEVTGLTFSGGKNSRAVSARVSFLIPENSHEFEDSVFKRPLRQSKIPDVTESVSERFKLGSNITVRHKDGRALLTGFPESYANWGVFDLVVGIGFAVWNGIPLFKGRRKIDSTTPSQTPE